MWLERTYTVVCCSIYLFERAERVPAVHARTPLSRRCLACAPSSDEWAQTRMNDWAGRALIVPSIYVVPLLDNNPACIACECNEEIIMALRAAACMHALMSRQVSIIPAIISLPMHGDHETCRKVCIAGS